MKRVSLFLIFLPLLYCTPKGPQTFDSSYIGKTKSDLISARGIAKKIKVFDNSEAYIYSTREEYFGKKVAAKKKAMPLSPKKIYVIEQIYYINDKGFIYKYQVWKKKIN